MISTVDVELAVKDERFKSNKDLITAWVVSPYRMRFTDRA